MYELSKNENLQSLNLALLARNVVEGFVTGLHRSPFHGFSAEFSERKPYNAGETLRNADWKFFARSGRLFTRQYQEETNLRCRLVIDCSTSMYYPDKNFNKIRFAATGAAAIIYLLKKQRDAFALSAFAEKITEHSAARSTTGHMLLMFSKLENLIRDYKKKSSSKIAETLHQIAENSGRKSMVVMFTDMMDSKADLKDLQEALKHLKYNKHEAILFHTIEQDYELDFKFSNYPYEFTDSESGVKILTNPLSIKESYIKEMQNFIHDLKLICGRLGVDYNTAVINSGFYPILHAWLLKRNRMI